MDQHYTTEFCIYQLNISAKYISIFPKCFWYNIIPHNVSKIKETEEKVKSESRVTPWTVQSMGFSRPEYWSG